MNAEIVRDPSVSCRFRALPWNCWPVLWGGPTIQCGRWLRGTASNLHKINDPGHSVLANKETPVGHIVAWPTHSCQVIDNPEITTFYDESYGSYVERYAGDFSQLQIEALFDDTVWPTESTQLSLGITEAWTKAEQVRWSYVNRIEYLCELAEDDEECAGLNESSNNDFWWFIESLSSTNEAELVLLDNGNLRAVWTESDGTHLGVQFLGDMTVEYVIFKRRPNSKQVSRVGGIDTFEGLRRQVEMFGIDLW